MEILIVHSRNRNDVDDVDQFGVPYFNSLVLKCHRVFFKKNHHIILYR